VSSHPVWFKEFVLAEPGVIGVASDRSLAPENDTTVD
jgi:hypothetical protein